MYILFMSNRYVPSLLQPFLKLHCWRIKNKPGGMASTGGIIPCSCWLDLFFILLHLMACLLLPKPLCPIISACFLHNPIMLRTCRQMPFLGLLLHHSLRCFLPLLVLSTDLGILGEKWSAHIIDYFRQPLDAKTCYHTCGNFFNFSTLKKLYYPSGVPLSLDEIMVCLKNTLSSVRSQNQTSTAFGVLLSKISHGKSAEPFISPPNVVKNLPNLHSVWWWDFPCATSSPSNTQQQLIIPFCAVHAMFPSCLFFSWLVSNVLVFRVKLVFLVWKVFQI